MSHRSHTSPDVAARRPRRPLSANRLRATTEGVPTREDDDRRMLLDIRAWHRQFARGAPCSCRWPFVSWGHLHHEPDVAEEPTLLAGES